MDLGAIMTISQVKFLGASIVGYNSSVGWNNQESKLDITLVEDFRNGDSFEVPIVGEPKEFKYEGFTFGGLIQSVARNDNSGGSPIYTITMVDPRSLLGGVKVILGDYSGQTGGVPNIINVFGYYESVAFGGSGSNGGGISWSKIKKALIDLIYNKTASNYGGQISYKGFNYRINFDNLPSLPEYFRISGDVSILDILQQVCDTGGCDYFVNLVDGDTIKVYTISRINIPDTGAIGRFITETPGAVAKSIGNDMVNDVCGKFLVGGKQREMFYQFYESANPRTFGRTKTKGGADAKESTGYDNPIWWHWGLNSNGSVIIGDGIENEHVFTLDSRSVDIPGIGDTYPCSMGEIRAALSNQSDWESYLYLMNYHKYIPNPNGTSKDQPTNNSKPKFKYKHNNVKNPHFGKAAKLGLYSGINNNLMATLQIFGNIASQTTPNFSFPYNRFQNLIPGKKELQVTKLYALIRAFADEYYGKKIMVMVPHINVAYDTETQRPIYSAYPTNGAFLSEALLPNAIQQKYVPLDINSISNPEDNTLKCYVRFDSIRTLDFSDISENLIFFSADGNSIFLECTVDTEIYFTNVNTFENPRVVVTLPGRVRFANSAVGVASITEDYLRQTGTYDDTNIEKIAFDMRNGGGFNPANMEIAALPAMAAIPFESQIARYGPWYARGAVGAMEFETDDSLTPWNYGTYSSMNRAAEAKVTANIANLQLIESGSLEFPGVPTLSLGEQLLSTGPYVSSVQVTIGSQGVTTSYRMETWKPRFGMLNKTVADGLAKAGKIYNQNRRNTQELLRRRKR